MADGIGDCKDFAVSRYIVGIALGIHPKHMLLIGWGRTKDPSVGHASLAFYDLQRRSWIAIENTGRSAKEKLGPVFSYNNNGAAYRQYMQDCEQGSLGRLVPLLGISRGGIFAFDSLEKHFSRNGVGVQKLVSVTAKPAQPIPSDKPAFYMFLPPVMAEAALAKPVFPARGETKAIKALTPHT